LLQCIVAYYQSTKNHAVIGDKFNCLSGENWYEKRVFVKKFANEVLTTVFHMKNHV